MALSEIENQHEVEIYTHKKFNCSYSHKKLGLCLRQREQQNNMGYITQSQTEHLRINKPSKGLFRPYALDKNNTTRKRNISKTLEFSQENHNTPGSTAQTSPKTFNQQLQDPLNVITTVSCPITNITVPTQTVTSTALSYNSYNMSLQMQRATYYMRYLAQLQHQNTAATLQNATCYPMGYPNVLPGIFNC